MAGTWEDAEGRVYADAGRKKAFGARIVQTATGLEFDFGQGEDPSTALGTVPVAANLVYSGPATGADAVPTFRAPVAADIPDLDAAKITTGALDKARQHAQTAYLDGTPVFTTTITAERTGATSIAIQARINTDTQARTAVRADGRIEMGPGGSTARDWFLAYQTTAIAGITGTLNISAKLGIGLSTLGTTPSGALHVQQSGSGAQDAIVVANNTTPNTGIGPAILFITASGGSINAGRFACLYNGSNVYYLSLQAQKAAAGGPVELMRLLAGGPVMIGTTVNSGAGEYEVVIPNAKNLRGLNAAGTSSLPLIGKDSSDRTEIGCNSVALSLASPSTGTTVGAAGGASALPATPTGYLLVRIGSTDRKIPYYAT